MATDRVSLASELMADFADRTGLTSARPQRRYLWTGAFAVANLLSLEGRTPQRVAQGLALELVGRVHHDLGRFRADDRRHGWISGLSEKDGEAHPTAGGLRIGKLLPERTPTEAFDADLEWHRDGQYFHYLTKWAYALDLTARHTGQAKLTTWARELMVAAHRGFVHTAHGEKRMVWKTSVDLSRPLVSSMGHHDPLDGLVTTAALDATAVDLSIAAEPSLRAAASDFADMIDPAGLATDDALGLGGLLIDACHLVQLEPANPDLITSVLAASAVGLMRHAGTYELRAPASARLGFRELGLAIGLAGVKLMVDRGWTDRLDGDGRRLVQDLARYLPLRDRIESFWLDGAHRHSSTWLEHADINDVMLATCLIPEAFLDRGSVPGAPSMGS